MTIITLREKLHRYIDAAEQKKLKAIYTMVENDMEEASMLTAEQKRELDLRMEEYLNGKGKSLDWDAAIGKIKANRKKQP